MILAEFGEERHPSYPDQDTDPNTPGPVRFDGPLHNEIPEPDRTVDNSTVWQPDYNREHYQRLYFGRTPPTSGSRISGRPDRRGDRRRAGDLRRLGPLRLHGDGNFNEPDGYIDHFQIVHAGGDQADGDPWQGEDAIWSTAGMPSST